MTHDPSTEFRPDRPKSPQSDPATEAFPEPTAEQSAESDRTRDVTPDQRPPAGAKFPSIPGYEIESELGRGGMGVVYKARDPRLNRTVALKMVIAGAHAGPNELARFKTEAEAVAGLNHPHIVQIFEVGEHDGLPFFTLEYCPNGSLAQRCADGPMQGGRAAELVEMIARGVSHAHAQGVVHRDLKPDNVLLASDGRESAELVPKVTDFGLAKKVDSGDGITGTGAVMGTPEYMAPEQASGGAKRVGPAADVWALGVILYRLLTGVVPFRGGDTYATIRRVIESEPTAPRSVNVSVPRDLEVITLKCLSKEPGRRYVSADALADDLRRWLDGRPIEARPAGKAERAWKWIRRNPAATAAAFALVAGVTVSTALAILAEQARVEAIEAQRAEATQRRQAERSRDTTEAFGNFLVEDFLGVARPEGLQGGLGVDVTVADALRAAEKKLTERFAGEPLAEAKARHAIGVTWRNLGEYEGAERHLRLAIELREQHLGENAEDTLDSWNSLGATLLAAGDDAGAVDLYERLLNQCEAELGRDHELTWGFRGNLASAYLDQGELDKAKALCELILERSESESPYGEFEAASAVNGLALAYLQQGRPDEAIPLMERNLTRMEDWLGEDHHFTIAARHNLASAYYEAGRIDEAIPLFELALGQRRDTLGERHPETIRTRDYLANAYSHAGRIEEAFPLLELALRQREDVLGPDHPETLMSRNNLASSYWRAGRLGRSVPMFEELLRLYEKIHGPDHIGTLSARANLGVNYKDAGRPDEAIPLLEDVVRRAGRGPDWLKARFSWVDGELAEAYGRAGFYGKAEPVLRARLDDVRHRFGPDDPRAAAAAAGLGELLLRQGKHVEAERPLRECLRIREKAMPSSWLTANARSMLGEALLGQGKHAEAEPVLLAGRSDMATAFDTGKPEELPPPAIRTQRLLEATGRLARLYDATDNSEEAAKWKAEWADLLLSRWPAPFR